MLSAERLLKRAKERAVHGANLAQGTVRSRRRVVDKAWGAFRVTRRPLTEALTDDPFVS